MTLVADFPRMWQDPATPQRERKRMVRLLLEDVTLLKADEVIAQLRFRGGAPQTLRLPLPLSAPELRKTRPAVVAEIDRLLDKYTDLEIAEIRTPAVCALVWRIASVRSSSTTSARSTAWRTASAACVDRACSP